MTIQFCERCGVVLVSVMKGDKRYLACKKCGIEVYGEYDLTIATKISEKTKVGRGVAEKNIKLGQEFKCKKCGNDKCEITDLGMMFGDEDWIYLLKCTKCSYAERVGDWC
ncbi:MAG: hypothetical protein V1888_03770 [archaeon]